MERKSLKILFVSKDTFPPFRVDVAVLFGKEMVARGHRLNWVLQSHEACKKAYPELWWGGKAWVGPTNNGARFIHRVHKHLLGFIHNIKCLRLIAAERYDCIQVKDRFFTAIAYLLAAKLLGITYFYWLSYPFAEASLYESKTKSARYPFVYFIRGLLYRFLLYKIIMKHADHNFVQSEQMRSDVHSRGIPENRMTPIPMGFEADLFSAVRHERNHCNDSRGAKIVYIGTLMKMRKMDFVIRMHAKVIKKIPDAMLYLVGKGETAEDIDILISAARNLGISESVVFTGFLDRTKALQTAKSADVCISPFFPTPVLNSTSPTKLIEYMALARPVVANDHPEQRRVIESSGGGICVPYREADFADAVVYLLKNPDIGKAMGVRGEKWVLKNRTYAKISDLVEQTYLRKVHFKHAR